MFSSCLWRVFLLLIFLQEDKVIALRADILNNEQRFERKKNKNKINAHKMLISGSTAAWSGAYSSKILNCMYMKMLYRGLKVLWCDQKLNNFSIKLADKTQKRLKVIKDYIKDYLTTKWSLLKSRHRRCKLKFSLFHRGSCSVLEILIFM